MGNPSELDIRQSVLRSALNMAGTAANATVDTVLIATDPLIGELFEDRNVLLANGGTIAYSGTAASFTEPLTLQFNSRIAGTVPTIINLGNATMNFVNNGDMVYATVNRSLLQTSGNINGSTNLTVTGSVAGIVSGLSISGPGIPMGTTVVSFTNPNVTMSKSATATTTGASITFGSVVLTTVTAGSALPAVSSANEQVFLIAKRIDDASGNQYVYFRNGFVMLNGESCTFAGPAAGIQNYPTAFAETEAEFVTALTAVAGGGLIVINQSMTWTAPYTLPSGAMLIGRYGGTVITLNSGAKLTMSTNSKLKEIWFTTANTSGDMIDMPNNYATIYDCQFTIPPSSTGNCINITGNSNRIHNTVFIGVMGETATGIYYDAGTNNSDTESVFLS